MSDKKRKSNGKEEVTDNAKRSKKSPENGNAVTSTSKPLLSGKEHEDLKRFLRERKKFLTQPSGPTSSSPPSAAQPRLRHPRPLWRSWRRT